MRGSRIRRMFGRKSKRGASLATVLVSMAILAIVATMFTAIAMRSYQYSYAKLCKQQAYYTATSTIESYYQTIRQSSEHLSSMINALEAAYQDAVEEENGLHVDPTRVSVKVGSSGGADSSGMLVDGGFFDTYLGECELYVRYANSDRSEISIEAHATYNGYTETARAKVARTNLAASELKKIFDNVFCLQSPITTIVADAAYGDVYVSQPMVSYFLDESGNKVTAGNEGAYNTVLASLEKDGSFGGYSAQPGQYLRDGGGTILTGDSIAGKYNAVLRDYVYANVQASTEEGGLTGHTKPLDMDNTPLYRSSALEDKDRWYNDWVELYMFSASTGGTTLDGNLYADSRVLVGLLDRNEAMREYVRYWDDTVKRSVYSKDNDSDTLTNYLQDNTFVELSLEAGFEHGFGKDVFFDHESTTLDRALSKFRINGNCYFWEDARIENFDSTQTENALSGIKNNIYAHKDLYIDGLYIYEWITATPETSSEVSIYGDVV
ncbi:MAG TPA: type II secretion system protein, partial [Candidatus Limadaptatus stercoripullorum]|nr:type II secretion system protein [Candidatus Limadaptatus stercoripullorum]